MLYGKSVQWIVGIGQDTDICNVSTTSHLSGISFHSTNLSQTAISMDLINQNKIDYGSLNEKLCFV